MISYKLAKEGKYQYFQKMSLINDLDPYEVPNKQWNSDPTFK